VGVCVCEPAACAAPNCIEQPVSISAYSEASAALQQTGSPDVSKP
jgi:hypothetical protein